MAHLREGCRLPERESDQSPSKLISKHGLHPLRVIDHLNATFMPATNARGEPA